MTTPLEAALAAYDSTTEEAAPEPEAGAEPEQPTAEPAPEPEAPPAPAVPPLSDLEKIAKERHAARAAEEKAASEKAELEELRRQVQALAQNKPAGLDPAMLRQNPLAAMRQAGLDDGAIKDVLKGLTTGILNPDVAALAQEIQALKHKQPTVDETLAQRLERLETQQQERLRHQAERDFEQLTATADKFPLLSRLTPQERVQYGWDVVNRYQQAGIQVTDEQVAAAAEAELKSKVERLTGGVTPQAAQGGPQKNPATQVAATPGAQGAPSMTLTSDLAANAAVSSADTFSERIAMAMKVLENRRAAG